MRLFLLSFLNIMEYSLTHGFQILDKNHVIGCMDGSYLELELEMKPSLEYYSSILHAPPPWRSHFNCNFLKTFNILFCSFWMWFHEQSNLCPNDFVKSNIVLVGSEFVGGMIYFYTNIIFSYFYIVESQILI